MANEVQIILKAVDQASANINKVTTSGNKLSEGFKALTGVSFGAAGAIALAGAAVKTILDFTKEAIAKNDAYVTSIVDMSRVLGLTTEETSKLVQASDDLFISQEKLNTAILAASRQGVDTSIEGLQRLSEKYLTLNAGVERAQFLMKTFGRSGADMGKLMELGADGIREAMDATSDVLVVTDNAVQIAYDYKRSLDSVQDSMAGFANSIGQEAMPQVTAFNLTMSHFIDKVNDSGAAVNLWAETVNLGKYALTGARFILDGFTFDLIEAEIAQDDLVLRGETLNRLYGASLIPTIEDLGTDISGVTGLFKEMTSEMLFAAAAEGLTNEQALLLAVNMGLVDHGTKVALESVEKIKKDFAETGDIETFNEEIMKVDRNLRGLPSEKSFTYTLYGNITGSFRDAMDAAGFSSPIQKPGDSGQGTGKATGGIGSGLTPVGEHGPELVNLPRNSRVYSNTQSNQMLQNAGGQSFDYYRFARIIAEELQKVSR